MVSRKHLRIVYKNNGWYVADGINDKSSMNGKLPLTLTVLKERGSVSAVCFIGGKGRFPIPLKLKMETKSKFPIAI